LKITNQKEEEMLNDPEDETDMIKVYLEVKGDNI
jgi:hypothetical protein